MDLWQRLNSDDSAVVTKAQAELRKDAAAMGMTAQQAYAELALHVEKISKSKASTFAGTAADVTVAKDEDGGEETETMTVKEANALRAAAAKAAGDAEADDDDGDDKSSRKVAGTTAKHAIRSGVSFKSVIGDAVRSYDITELGHDMPGASQGEDALGRGYSDETGIDGELYQTMGGLGAIPVAGAGPTHEGYGGNAGAKFMPSGEGERGRAGGEDGHGDDPARPNQGRASGYTLEVEGKEPGNVAALRLADNWLLPGKSGMGEASEVIFPSAKTSPVLKRTMPERAKARPKGFWPKDISSNAPSDPTLPRK